MSPEHERDLQTFITQLGAAMNATGQPVDVVQERLQAVAAAGGAGDARISAGPTSVMVAMGRGGTATLELTTPLDNAPRLDQIAAVDQLSEDAAKGIVLPADGLSRLDEIRDLPRRFGPWSTVFGYALLTVGICLVLQPAMAEVAAAALFGVVVGVLRTVAPGQRPLQVLMPVVAAFIVSLLSSLSVAHGIADPGLRAVVASLVVFLPGSALTTAVLELASGEMVAGASRLVWGVAELAFLAFGILAGIAAGGVPASAVFTASGVLVGAWAPPIGVLVFAIGVTVSNSAPRRSFLGLVLVLYAAWIGQLLGNTLFGVYIGAAFGATVMTMTALMTSRLPSAMPAHASFLPGFWLLVPGALGLITLTEYVESGGMTSGDLLAVVGSILGVALGVLAGTQLWTWARATRNAVGGVSNSLSGRVRWPRRPRG